jgi:MoaA/NifB/PqqE/SkfB family radical SAM enzyme
MNNKLIKKEMSLDDFKKTLLKMKKNPKIKVIKLLGGEPTLHSKFKEITNLSLKYFPYVQIFTNGIFSDDLANFLISKTPNVAFTFNVTTPGFLLNPKIRSLVSLRIKGLAKKTIITLSLTFDMNSDINLFFKAIGEETLSLVHQFRLGFANPIAGEKNLYQFTDFPKMGQQLVNIVSIIRKNNPKGKISLNCGFTRCMFNENQFEYIKKEVEIPGFGCFGKESSFDLQTDLTAFHCFPLSPIDKIDTRHKSFSSANNQLLKKRFSYWAKIRQQVCLKCPFYGFGGGKCPGPCLGFLKNKYEYKQVR